jgi:drug/metabolite transporter (DMT)-like permease
MFNNENKGFLYGFIAVLGFGLTLPISKELLQYFNPFFIAFGRAGIAGILAIVFLLTWGKKLPDLRQFKQLIIVALGVVIGFPLFSTIAMQSIPASHGAVMLGLLPLSTASIGVLLTQERPSIAFWLFCILGSILVLLYTLLEGNGALQQGDWFLLIALSLVSIGYALGAKLTKEIDGWEVISWSLVLSLPFILLAIWWYLPSNIEILPYSGYISFLYLGVVSQFFAFIAWYKGLSLGGIARVSQVQLIQTFVTLIASSLILNEKISMRMIVFTILIILTIWIGKQMPIYRKERINNAK